MSVPIIAQIPYVKVVNASEQFQTDFSKIATLIFIVIRDC